MKVDGVSASDIAALVDSTAVGLDQHVIGIRPLSDPAAQHLSFAVDVEGSLTEIRTALELGAVVMVPHSGIDLDHAGTLIAVERPRAAFAEVVTEYFAPRITPGIAESAVIDPTASISATASIGEFTVVGPGVRVGDGTELRHHCVIGRNVQIGSNCLIKSNAVIGEEGFGLETDRDGNNFRLPHLGSVHIGDFVEVGSFTSINSGTISPTIIDDFVKISDNVHVSHNCRIGRNTIVTGCVELSGSVTVGSDVWLAPNVSVREKLTIGDDATVGIGAVVVRSIEPGEVHYGNPARLAP